MDATLFTRYQINPKLAAIGLLIYAQGAASGQGVTINFPADDAYGVKMGAEYQFAKSLKAKLLYGYFWLDTKINLPVGLNAVGREKLHVNQLDFSITYDV